MLILPIKKKWFDMIVKGEKKEEYRETKPYYTKRFQNIGLLDDRGITTNQLIPIALRNGYSANDPTLHVGVVLKHGYGKKEWGAVEGESYYCLEVREMYSIDVNGRTQYIYRNNRLL